MALDRLHHETVLELGRLRDPVGVISVYVGSTPERQAGTTPQWAVAIRNQIRELRQRVKEEGPREHWMAVSERLDALGPELEEVLDPKAYGRGRALFAPVSAKGVRRFAVQTPSFSDAVVLESTAYLRPLVAALDAGRPTGIVAVDRSGIRVLEWRFGEVEELATHRFEEGAYESRELTGPAAANPAMHQQGASQKDRFEERLEEHRIRFLRTTAGGEVRGEITRRGWDRVVVAGDGKYSQPVAEEVTKGNNGYQVLRDEHDFHHKPSREIADTMLPRLQQAQADREVALVEQARSSALSGGHGAIGLDDVLGALGEGRVSHLLYDDARELRGFRADTGTTLLFSERNAPAGEELVREPLLVERMVERAFETSALVTPVTGQQATELLAPHEGVAALLRW